MNPTLCELDLLEVCPYAGRRAYAGDVIFFRPPGGDNYVVHRVVSTGGGIRTKGDRPAAAIDPWVLAPSDVEGRVVAAWRGNKRRKIAGGWIGGLSVKAAHARRRAKRVSLAAVTLLCRILCRNRALRRFITDRMVPRVVRFESTAGTHIRLMLGRRVIGRYAEHRWHIDRPFNVFLDDSTLPKS